MDLWKYKGFKKLYENNLFPVIMSRLRKDELTLPPNVKCRSGRPRARRMRKRPQKDGMRVLEQTQGSGDSEVEEEKEDTEQ